MLRTQQSDGSIIGAPTAVTATVEDDGALVCRDARDKTVARFEPLTIAAYGKNDSFLYPVG
jgi:hypothetical protein